MFGFGKSKAEELTPEEEEKVREKFESFKNKTYTEDDMNKVFEEEDNIMNKMKNKNLKEYIDLVKVFFSLLKDFVTGKYKQVPVGVITAIVLSLLYVFLPVDIIPDFLPVVGYLDDASVLALCLKFVSDDIEKYKAWKGEE